MQRYYFDHNATTPVDPFVLERFTHALSEVYGNASSIHFAGQTAKQQLEAARKQVAGLLGADSKEIVLLSGGTEANNLAIRGLLESSGVQKPHVIVTALEHPATLEPVKQLGCEVTVVQPESNGVMDPEKISDAIKANTALVVVMHVNNETGVIQPISDISQRIAGRAKLHVDGVQAAGKIPVDFKALGADTYAISGHKLYAPKGTGALLVKKGVELKSQQFGGRHEQGRRAGTENVPGAVALGAAAHLAQQRLTTESQRLSELRDHFESAVQLHIAEVSINGGSVPRAANTSSLLFRGVEGEAIVIALDLRGFAISSGSACSSGAVEPSHVLLSMGLSRADARSSVRISLGRENTKEQVDLLVGSLVAAVGQLRRIAPTSSCEKVSA
jgi:cysteine desulfurase